MSNFRFTEEQVQFVIKHGSSVGTLELTQMFNDHFKVNNKVTSIQNLKGRLGIKSNVNSGCFKKGSKPWNKGVTGYMGANATSFKKGNISPNTVPVGTEKVSKDDIIIVKVADEPCAGKKNWVSKHKMIYEQHHGKVPEGYIVIFADGNRRNFDVDNLIAVSRGELLKLNRYGRIHDDSDITKSNVLLTRVEIKTNERKKTKMKKLLIMIIAAVIMTANINNVDAKTFYNEPTHIVKMLKREGYTFNTPEFGGFAEYSYKLEGKNVTYTDVSGYLRGIAHAYDIVTKTSETSEYFKVFEKDFDNLAYYLFEHGFEFSDPQTAFIEAFMMYCLYEDEFEKECSSLHSYIKNNVMKFKFDDVPETAWYRPYVEDVYYLGLMTGASNTLFKPNATMNRGMVATVLHRMSGSVEMEYFPFFSDLSNNQYYTVPVVWCYSTGIIHGYSDNTFRPLKNVTREEMVTMLYRFAKYKNVDVRGKNGVTEGFKDYNKVSTYAKTAMNWAVSNGIISGKDNGTRLDPKGTATRAECAKMLVKLNELVEGVK